MRKTKCRRINVCIRTCNLEIFNECLQNTIDYYICKSKFSRDDIKTLLGANHATMHSLYHVDEHSYISFKLIYDFCIALNIQVSEFVERLEGMF